MVEAQHQIATRKLVNSNAEHELLEAMLDDSKPSRASGPEFEGLHYLLATPFRYPPLRHGSRFGRVHERGIWYGSTSVGAVLAEVAFYRLLFLTGTQAPLEVLATEHSLFAVGVSTERGVDLTQPPFQAHRAALVDRRSYAATQPLGTAMREDGVEGFFFPSARDPELGTNVGVLTPKAFASRSPERGMQTWHCTATRSEVVFHRRGVLERTAVAFPAAHFEVGGAIVAPG